MSKIYIDRIMGTSIPDIHPVYGGVRGKTMSSRQQGYAWPIIKKAGIHTIIDLRNDGVNQRMTKLCEEFGLEYFYYPVDNKAEMIESMVELFPSFCERIERGGFYIACALGLHRTDIALCLYWVFYGADKGIAPPELWGYLRESGHDTAKIQRVLNAFYVMLSNKNGMEPMSSQEFKRRKQVINELSRKQEEKSNKAKKTVYVSMNDTLMGFRGKSEQISDDLRIEYKGRYDEIPNLVSYLQPLPGATEAMKLLKQCGLFDVYIFSASAWKNPTTWSDKVEWVDRHLDKYYRERLILSHHKELLKGDYIIDNHGKHGTNLFDGEWIRFGSPDFPDWESVVTYLLDKEGN